MKTFGVVGATGLVGQHLVRELLKLPECQKNDIVLFASDKNIGKSYTFNKRTFQIKSLNSYRLDTIDIWFFATPKLISSHWIPIILKKRVKELKIIDGSSAFRLIPSVPLIIPEINAEYLKKAEHLVSSPNCTATIALMALYPLHKTFRLSRFWLHSYQSISGMGNDGIQIFETQLKEAANGNGIISSDAFAFNAIPQIGLMDPEGISEEERKIMEESKKILSLPNLKIFANCVRIPSLWCHAITLNAEFKESIHLQQAQELLQSTVGLRWFQEEGRPTALDCAHKHDCGVGRLRLDPILENGLSLWVVGDSLLKGAALNMVQIYQAWSRL